MGDDDHEIAEELHVPVLRDESLHFLSVERGGWFVDCTLGLGGHTEAILERNPETRVLGIDRDPRALELAAERLARFGDRVRFIEGNFSQFDDLLDRSDLGHVAGILADLGVSSMQLDTPERGFSFRFDGRLDMRMGEGDLTAEDVVREYSEADLIKIFREFGEERHARRIARAIVAARAEKPLETTRELRDLIHSVVRPPRPHQKRIDPATRVFQALRIEVNEELASIRSMLDLAVKRLEQDGRLVVLAYHSLEDRIVKHTFRALAAGDKDPVTGATRAESRVIEVMTGKPVRAGASEVSMNPRSRSAKLRAARRL